MALSTLPIAYCANVHPGDTLAEVRQAIVEGAGAVRRHLQKPVAVGLWLTRNALREALSAPEYAGELARLLADLGLACYTMNAFPFGDFHARRVKEAVYLPDWTSPKRRSYTLDVAALLARLLPPGAEGSISTLPCGFRPLHPPGADASIYFRELVATAVELAGIEQRSGRRIRLALEPEPGCVLETTAQAVHFFEKLFRRVAGRPEEQAVREHLGLCYDICHQAVGFEDPAASIAALQRAGVRIGKVHITCALELADPKDAAARRHLADFAEERYLHQTSACHPSQKRLFEFDLTAEHALTPPPEWLECPRWRVHFHVPVHQEQLGLLRTTRPILAETLRQIARLPYAPHLEVETYTWNVLPGQPQSPGLVAGLQAELASTDALLAALRTETLPEA